MKTHKEQYRIEYEKELDARIREALRELEELFVLSRFIDSMFEKWYTQKFPNGS